MPPAAAAAAAKGFACSRFVRARFLLSEPFVLPPPPLPPVLRALLAVPVCGAAQQNSNSKN